MALVPLFAAAALAAAPLPAPGVPPMDATVQDRLVPQTEALLVQVLAQQRDLVIDGQKVFSSGDKFLGGKIADGMAYLILATPRDDPRFARYIAGFREVSRLTLDDHLDTWGIYYYVSALTQLQQAGLLEQCVDADTLAKLKVKLDWRTFVRPDLSLIDLPNNYYGVAFAIAGLRHRLGWEDDSGMTALVTRVLGHYRSFSESGFADETEGDGRFDRYSVLLIAEIAHHYLEAGLEPPAEVKTWLRGSAQLVLTRINANGDGFEYGRSIGAYGDTSFVEILTIAARLGVLTPAEKDAAYAFVSRSAQRYMAFWVDAGTGSVNLWDHGRRTDAYRGKHRILGENLSLAQQYEYTNALWNEMGYKDRMPATDLGAWRRAQPALATTWFARGHYQRALVTRRDGDRMFGLAMINGGDGQHDHSPYFPLPFSPGLIAGMADTDLPQLVPQITLTDGSRLAPLSFTRHISVTHDAHAATVTTDQDALDRFGQAKPVADARVKARSVTRFAAGVVSRSDTFVPASAQDVSDIAIEFASYSPAGQLRHIKGKWIVDYTSGATRQFTVSAFSRCELTAVDDKIYETPTVPFASRLRCTTGPLHMARPVTLGWSLRYRRNIS